MRAVPGKTEMVLLSDEVWERTRELELHHSGERNVGNARRHVQRRRLRLTRRSFRLRSDGVL